MEENDPKEIAKKILNKSKKVDTDKVLETARMLLLIIAAISFFNAVVLWSSIYTRYILLGQMVGFILLYVFSKKEPKIAFVLGLIFYIIPIGALTIWSYIVITLSFGLLVRVIIIGMLIWGIIVSHNVSKKEAYKDETLDAL